MDMPAQRVKSARQGRSGGQQGDPQRQGDRRPQRGGEKEGAETLREKYGRTIRAHAGRFGTHNATGSEPPSGPSVLAVMGSPKSGARAGPGDWLPAGPDTLSVGDFLEPSVGHVATKDVPELILTGAREMRIPGLVLKLDALKLGAPHDPLLPIHRQRFPLRHLMLPL